MKRTTIDKLASWVGFTITAILIVSGALLTWAHNFVGDQVKTQLSEQQIFFPAKGSKAIAGPDFTAMQKYAGQQLTTGAQAETYADHFIAVHLKEIGWRPDLRAAQHQGSGRPDEHRAGRSGRHDVQG